MTQIVKRAIQQGAVDGDKIKLLNGQSLKGTLANGTEVNLFTITNADELVFVQLPKFEGSDLATKADVSAEIEIEASSRASGDLALEGMINAEKARLDTLEPKVSTLETKMTTAEGNITSLQGADVDLGNRITNEIATEKSEREDADAQLQASINSLASGLSWREKAFLISSDAELLAATEGQSLSTILPFNDDESPIISETEIPVGALLLANGGGSSKVMKVYEDAGIKKVTFIEVAVLTEGDTFVVAHDLIDSPSAQENRAVYTFTGVELVKVGDIDWAIANGIDLGPDYTVVQGQAITLGDSVEVAIGKLEGQILDAKAEASSSSSNLSGRVDDVEAKDAEQDGRLDAIEAKDIEQDGKISTLEAQMSTANGNHTDLEARVTDIEDVQIPSKLNASEKGAVGGVATLDASGFVPSTQLKISAPEVSYTPGNAGQWGTLPSNVQDALDIVNNKQAGQIVYTPADSTKWSVAPTRVAGALDELAFRIKGNEESMGNYILQSEKGAANGVVPLNAQSLIDSVYLPSYVDDVEEYLDLASFPATGEAGKIYVALDTNKTYRWSGSAYIYITSGAVDSVNGKTGVVSLNTDDIAEGASLYYTEARFDASFALKNTDALAEGATNLYYTEARATASFDSNLAFKNTDNLAEGASNLYFTDARAKASAIVNSMAGAEVDQAPSVQSVKDYIAAAASKIFAPIFVLTSTDVTNGYIELSEEASVVLDVTPKGFVSQFEGDDYSLSVASGKTRITFAGDMLSLTAGDKVKVMYAK